MSHGGQHARTACSPLLSTNMLLQRAPPPQSQWLQGKVGQSLADSQQEPLAQLLPPGPFFVNDYSKLLTQSKSQALTQFPIPTLASPSWLT